MRCLVLENVLTYVIELNNFWDKLVLKQIKKIALRKN